MDIKQEIKIILAREDITMKELVERLNHKYGRSGSLQNMSNKLSKDTLKYQEALEIADVLGYEIVWKGKE